MSSHQSELWFTFSVRLKENLTLNLNTISSNSSDLSGRAESPPFPRWRRSRTSAPAEPAIAPPSHRRALQRPLQFRYISLPLAIPSLFPHVRHLRPPRTPSRLHPTNDFRNGQTATPPPRLRLQSPLHRCRGDQLWRGRRTLESLLPSRT
jgi:hypothetical protein